MTISNWTGNTIYCVESEWTDDDGDLYPETYHFGSIQEMTNFLDHLDKFPYHYTVCNEDGDKRIVRCDFREITNIYTYSP